MLKLEIVKSTACMMLKDSEGNLVDHQFVNKYYFDNFMTWDDFQKDIQAFLLKNNVTEFIDGGFI